MIFERWVRKRQRLSGGQRRQTQQAISRRERRLKRAVMGAAYLVLVLAVTRRVGPSEDTAQYDLDGIVAQDTFTAEIDFQSEDIELTREAREAAAAKMPDVFRVNEDAVKRSLARLETIRRDIKAQREGVEEAVRAAVRASGHDKAETAAARAVKAHAENLLKTSSEFSGITNADSLAEWLTPRPDWVRALVRGGRSSEGASGDEAPSFDFANSDLLGQLTRGSLERVLRAGVLKRGEAGSGFSKDPDRRILVLHSRADAGAPAEEEVLLTQALSVDSAYGALRERISKAAQEQLAADAGAQVDRIALQDAALEVGRLCLTDTLRYDDDETRLRRETARLSIDPQMKTIYKGEEIQRRGARWTPQSRQDVRTYLAEKARYDKQTANVAGALVGHMVLIGLILMGIERAIPLLIPRRSATGTRDLNLVLLLACATVVVGRVIVYFDDTGYIVPAAAAAILLAILTNARVGGLASIMLALLLSIQYDYSWRLMIVCCAMSFTGVMSISMVRKRSDMGSAAVKSTMAGVLALVGFALAQDSLFSGNAFRGLVAIALNGLMCLFLVPGLLSPLEKLFGITTDIQLLEYSDLNNHILSRLAMEVPATYAHSLMLGQLAEAAADAVGANGLLARVSAYYHDIGKLRRPEYFAENQTGANVHDAMSPRLSARAIASHVTEGAEMARQLKLPKPLVDAILEHHGTCFISFFYQEAVAQQKHGGVIEADFRYSGPRPQSRETAILMICDAVESAVRTVKNPNEERVRELIDRIIANRASDRQFDECDLTLRDLDTISEVLTKRSLSTQHRRITYPDQTPKTPAPNIIALSGGHEK
jgi:hypothetical protein